MIRPASAGKESSSKSDAAPVRRKPRKRQPAMTINTVQCKYDIVRECSQRLGFKDVDDTIPWLLYWIDTGVSVERVLSMKPFQRINHFPGMHEICRKDRLARNLERLSRLFPKEANFFPRSWILPVQWSDFQLHCKGLRRKCFIAKPNHGCQGKGIFLFRDPKEVIPIMDSFKVSGGSLIVQKYLHRPCLIDGYKFDLRIYALVTSADPLRIFVYREGLARFATEPYRDPHEDNLDNVCMHLTNYAINKHSTNFHHSSDHNEGSKRSMSSVFRRLATTKGSAVVDKLWNRIKETIVKTLLTIQPQLKQNLQACFRSRHKTDEQDGDLPAWMRWSNSQCFEILGFDVFLDHKLKPWILEVNHSPSFTCDTVLDTEVKRGVISDALRLLNMDAVRPKRFEQQQKLKSRSRLLGAVPTNVDSGPHPVRERLAVNDHSDDSGKMESSSSLDMDACKSPDKDEWKQQSDFGHETPPVSEKTAKALAEYNQQFPSGDLALLAAFEDANLGGYERAFPPADKAKFGHYLTLMRQAAEMFSETLATRRRKEHLMEMKRREEAQLQKLQSWREARQSRKTRSVPELRAPGFEGHGLTQRLASDSALYSSHGSTSASRESPPGCSFRSRNAARDVKLKDRMRGKVVMKVNVECLNERFSDALFLKQQEAVSRLSYNV
ncbi:tubulin-tyrosine ligase family-domain-containing protein [Gaertneriomyces semiglobifer]|nr:tubulin-tyrosine ligase family-domain-containing protein [Gaertneriomyces semiglobifer]